MNIEASRREDVRAAFDGVAAEYDGPLGNNNVVQWMRGALQRAVAGSVPPGSTLLDLGCGTGIDAVHLATQGYRIVATDWSPQMSAATRERVRRAGIGDRVDVLTLGMHELDRLPAGSVDCVYSNLGALNCASDLSSLAAQCARLLRPNGSAVFSVIGRICPWETAYYLLRGRPARAFIRWKRGSVPVPLNGGTVWTRYYTPGELGREMGAFFELRACRALCLLSPPPYMLGIWNRMPGLCRLTAALDEKLGGFPLLRHAGDHFLVVLTPRSRGPAVQTGR